MNIWKSREVDSQEIWIFTNKFHISMDKKSEIKMINKMKNVKEKKNKQIDKDMIRK